MNAINLYSIQISYNIWSVVNSGDMMPIIISEV